MPDLDGLDDWLARREAGVAKLRPGCAKRIVWAEGPHRRTPVSVLYIHGFSASPEEIRPVPDRIAEGLGANLHFTRLTGHGQDGPAMATASLAAWKADVAEGLEIADRLGERTLVVACSTGCTLAALAAADGAEIAGHVYVSPNFGLSSRLAGLTLNLPLARFWAPWFTGPERGFDALSDAHEAYWTSSYPTIALFPMAHSLQAVMRAPLGRITAPVLAFYNAADRVVSANATERTLRRWGGPVTRQPVVPGPEDDPTGHVIAGDIFSPGQTGPVVERALDWARQAL